MTTSDAGLPDPVRSTSLDELVARLRAHGARDARYRSIGEIGRGGMGAIVEVWDDELHRSLALKRALPRKPADDEDGSRSRELGRFVEEAQITGQLEHPGIVPVHEIGVGADGSVYFTMRRVRGRTLLEVFELACRGEDGWNSTRVLHALLRSCEAVAYAHSKNVIHRDLKPANVMVGSFGEVYVIDWGLARILGEHDARDLRLALDDAARATALSERQVARSEAPDSSLVTLDGEIVGTPAYMSPEQARGEELSAAADTYSLGAMLYHLLAGRPPYLPAGRRISAFEILMAVRDGPPSAIALVAPATTPELAAICDRAMARNPAARYATTLELADDLRRFLEGRVVRAYRTGAWQELKKWVQRNRGMAASLLGLVAAVTIGTGAAAWIQHENARVQGGLNDRILGLSDATAARDLSLRSDALWPSTPANAAGLRAWIAEAKGLHERVAYQRESLERIGEVQGTESRRTWLRESLEAAIRDLEVLPQRVVPVEARLAMAESLEERTRAGTAARAAWERATDEIAASPRYGGLRIAPQLGLVPLGPDAQSGLWEFWHALSGDEPPYDAEKKRRVQTEASGLVLVLIPGGSWTVGSREQGDTFVDPWRQLDETLFEGVELAPFFASKYETTQAQWTRIMGNNPSTFGPSSRELAGVTLLHPAETLSWFDAREIARRLDVEIPTETQWEVLCRAGTSSVFSFGPDAQDFARYANCGDAVFLDQNPQADRAVYSSELNDGFAVHAPVGSFAPNAFGVFDAHGNVWEWCLDDYSFDARPAGPSGLRPSPEGVAEVVIRGGSWFTSDSGCRAAKRFPYEKPNTDQDLGVRFVRRLDR